MKFLVTILVLSLALALALGQKESTTAKGHDDEATTSEPDGETTTTEKEDPSCDIKFQIESECSNEKDEALTACVNCVLEQIR